MIDGRHPKEAMRHGCGLVRVGPNEYIVHAEYAIWGKVPRESQREDKHIVARRLEFGNLVFIQSSSRGDRGLLARRLGVKVANHNAANV
jgi:hypothetical protein